MKKTEVLSPQQIGELVVQEVANACDVSSVDEIKTSSRLRHLVNARIIIASILVELGLNDVAIRAIARNRTTLIYYARVYEDAIMLKCGELYRLIVYARNRVNEKLIKHGIEINTAGVVKQ